MSGKILLFLIGVFLIPLAAPAYDLYVQSAKAPVYAMPDMSSGILATYKKGTKLTGIEHKGNWHVIRVDGGGTGWVYRFLVSEQPLPHTGESSDLINQYTDFSTNARRRPSSYTAAAAARGLREKNQHFAEQYALDYEALEKIEAIQISDEELMSFIKQGTEHEN